MKYYLSTVIIFLSFIFSRPGAKCQDRFIISSDPHLQFEGRTIDTLSSTLLSWPGNSVTLRFKGTYLKAILMDTDTADYFNVIVDKKVIKRIHLDKNKHEYALVNQLKQGTHTVELFKLTESNHGNCLFFGFLISPQSILLETKPKSKRIEFYGNSITCGYAVEDGEKDRGGGYYENNYTSYAAITARKYNAHYSCISKSGIGLTVSWFPLIMPEMYDRSTEYNAFKKWDFNKWTPDIVVVNLFQNDAWITEIPSNPEYIHRFADKKVSDSFFISEYATFIKSIREKYPISKIICSIGSMDASKQGSKWVEFIKKALNQMSDRNIYFLSYPYKETPGHPKISEQKNMADILIRFIDSHHLWN